MLADGAVHLLVGMSLRTGMKLQKLLPPLLPSCGPGWAHLFASSGKCHQSYHRPPPSQ